jgi:polyhydroxybutyrate depolymerase
VTVLRRTGKRAAPRRSVPQRVRLSVNSRPAAVAAVAVLASLAAVVPFALSSPPSVSAAPSSSSLLPPPVPASPPAAPERVLGPGTPAGDSRIVDLTVGDEQRAYFLLPALNLPAGTPASLLVVLHQDVGSAREMSVGLGLDDLRKRGITLAYPSGIGGSWNAGACCGIALARGVDDVGFVNAVLDDVGRHTPVDPASRALLGYSGGGMLAYRLLCTTRPQLVAAVEINGSLEAHCPNGLRLPDLLAIHGEKDGSIGLTTSRYVNHLKMAPRSVTSTLANVTGQAGCDAKQESTVNGIDLWTWKGCRGGSTVQAQIVPDAGHAWADVGGAARATSFLLPRLARGPGGSAA